MNCIDGIGRRSAISISKTKNRTARIKNRMENGIRAELWGSNPHSKGVLFSKLKFIYLFNNRVTRIITIGNNLAINIIIRRDIFLGGNTSVNEVKIHCYCKLLGTDVGILVHI